MRADRKQIASLLKKIREVNTPNCEHCGGLMEPKYREAKEGQTNYYVCRKCGEEK